MPFSLSTYICHSAVPHVLVEPVTLLNAKLDSGCSFCNAQICSPISELPINEYLRNIIAAFSVPNIGPIPLNSQDFERSQSLPSHLLGTVHILQYNGSPVECHILNKTDHSADKALEMIKSMVRLNHQFFPPGNPVPSPYLPILGYTEDPVGIVFSHYDTLKDIFSTFPDTSVSDEVLLQVAISLTQQLHKLHRLNTHSGFLTPDRVTVIQSSSSSLQVLIKPVFLYQQMDQYPRDYVNPENADVFTYLSPFLFSDPCRAFSIYSDLFSLGVMLFGIFGRCDPLNVCSVGEVSDIRANGNGVSHLIPLLDIIPDPRRCKILEGLLCSQDESRLSAEEVLALLNGLKA
ncbi:hypothetical protein GEMRC1_011987 [Eukaryota sp. GEM-RC1]